MKKLFLNILLINSLIYAGHDCCNQSYHSHNSNVDKAGIYMAAGLITSALLVMYLLPAPKRQEKEDKLPPLKNPGDMSPNSVVCKPGCKDDKCSPGYLDFTKKRGRNFYRLQS